MVAARCMLRAAPYCQALAATIVIMLLFHVGCDHLHVAWAEVWPGRERSTLAASVHGYLAK
eukprot:366131-Chlamydomonas_euryale.AAC.39